MKNETYEDADTVRASVCMATYRGAAFVEDQISSILSQLGTHDELVIVDDCSPDATVSIIRGIRDERISLTVSDVNEGYVRTFEKAVSLSSGKFVFLSDQDDVWTAGRLDRMLDALTKNPVVATNFAMLGGGPRPWIPLLSSTMDRRRVANLIGILIGYRAYYGCGMALRREIVEVVLPIPPYVRESHDLWIAICGIVGRGVGHLDEPSLLRRIHGGNETPTGVRSIKKIFRARIMLIRLIIEAKRRLRSPKFRL